MLSRREQDSGRRSTRSGPQTFTRDQANPPLKRHVRPGPFAENGDAIPKTYEPENVYEEPDEPRQNAGYFQPPDLGNGRAAADRGHVAVIVIPERRRRL